MFTGFFRRSGSEAAYSVAESEELKDSIYQNFRENGEVMSDFNRSAQDEPLDTQTTSIGADTTIQGDLDIKGQLNVYGVVEGQIRCDSEVFIGETGRVTGDILAMNIRVSGYMEGGLECGELTIEHSGKVTGEAATDSFKIEEGGQFEGSSRRRTTDNVTQLKRSSKRGYAIPVAASKPE